ncbi:MAG: hypothetical protein ACRCSN_02085 [Dermatophilaceae bacterium]
MTCVSRWAASSGLLAHQGMRPTTKGGRYVIERAVLDQLGNF